MKFNWSCIRPATLNGDITTEFTRIGCNYYHFAYARLNLIAGDYTFAPMAHAERDEDAGSPVSELKGKNDNSRNEFSAQISPRSNSAAIAIELTMCIFLPVLRRYGCLSLSSFYQCETTT